MDDRRKECENTHKNSLVVFLLENKRRTYSYWYHFFFVFGVVLDSNLVFFNEIVFRQVVSLGDIFDRGVGVKRILELFKTFKTEQNATFHQLLGNHDFKNIFEFK